MNECAPCATVNVLALRVCYSNGLFRRIVCLISLCNPSAQLMDLYYFSISNTHT